MCSEQRGFADLTVQKQGFSGLRHHVSLSVWKRSGRTEKNEQLSLNGRVFLRYQSTDIKQKKRFRVFTEREAASRTVRCA